MCIWLDFKTNLRLLFKNSPDPKEYSGELIYNYPFDRNESNQILIANQTEEKAWQALVQQIDQDGDKRNALGKKYYEACDENNRLFDLGLVESAMFHESKIGKEYQESMRLFGEKLDNSKLSYQAKRYLRLDCSPSSDQLLSPTKI